MPNLERLLVLIILGGLALIVFLVAISALDGNV